MPHLSVIIPAYNESRRLPETLVLINDYLQRQKFSSELLIIDDGSTDNTVKVVREFKQRIPSLRLIENQNNRGKGAVVRQGMLEAAGDWRLFADADNSTPITELDKLLPWQDAYPIIIGSRYLQPGSIKIKQPWKRRLISRTCNFVIQASLLPGIYDTQCGFKLFSAQAADQIFPRQSMTGWSFDIEVLTIARSLGLGIKEVPVDWFDAKRSTFHAARDTGAFIREFYQIWNNVRSEVYTQIDTNGS